MNKRIKKIIAVLTAVSALAAPCTVMAVQPGYTGWSNETGSPRYFENGAMAVNKWVRNGQFYYFVGDNGYVVPGRVICISDISETYIKQLDPNYQAPAPAFTVIPQYQVSAAGRAVYPANAAALQAGIDAQKAAAQKQLAALQKEAEKNAKAAAKAAAAQTKALQALQAQALAAAAANAQAAQAANAAAAAGITAGATADQVRRGEKQASDITSDYEAFKYLHPELVSTYGSDTAGLYGKYMSTYGGGAAGGVYLATIARLYAINANTPHFNQSYEDQHNGTHKAYTGSGDWIIESCDDYKHNSEGYRKCSKCGHVFKHMKLDDYNN